MQCPHCTAQLPDDDLFCEECGERLLTSDNEQASAGALCLCGAPDEELDEDGYCLSCGKRCRPAVSDHQEVEVTSDFAAVSDLGLCHKRNEDRFAVCWQEGRSILVVCDGVSHSSNAGEAAAFACNCIADLLAKGSTPLEAVKEAQRQIVLLANPVSIESCPSTTVVAAVATAEKISLAWLGDSRAYWISQEEAKQLSTDHSWVNAAVFSDQTTDGEAAQEPLTHGITRWLGADAGADMLPDSLEFLVPGPGLLLLCSDGLWNYAAQPTKLKAILDECFFEEETTLQTARRLVEFANRQGGQDNITAALLRWGTTR